MTPSSEEVYLWDPSESPAFFLRMVGPLAARGFEAIPSIPQFRLVRPYGWIGVTCRAVDRGTKGLLDPYFQLFVDAVEDMIAPYFASAPDEGADAHPAGTRVGPCTLALGARDAGPSSARWPKREGISRVLLEAAAEHLDQDAAVAVERFDRACADLDGLVVLLGTYTQRYQRRLAVLRSLHRNDEVASEIAGIRALIAARPSPTAAARMARLERFAAWLDA